MTQSIRIAAKAAAITLLAAALSNCIIIAKPDRNPTVGEELTQLKEAQKKGVITESEYKTQKDRLLAKP